MNKRYQNSGRVFWAMLCLCLGTVTANAALVDLDAYVSFAILDHTGSTPLANGSIVYIVGSTDAIGDPMVAVGSPPTNYIAYSTTGDDEILGTVYIGDNVDSNGTFYTTLQYDSALINYVYIRYFEFTNEPVTGMVYWGTSAVYQLGVTLGVATVDFNPDGNLSANLYSNFVVIPEPSTANLLVLVVGMAFAMHTARKGKGQKQEDGVQYDDKNHED